MKLLAIATSPLQVQNSIQYIRQAEIDFRQCALAHVGSVRAEDNERALSIANRFEWSIVKSFDPFQALKAADIPPEADLKEYEIEHRKAFIDKISLFFSEQDISDLEIVLMGDYRPMSFRQFLQFTAPKQPEIVLLDDGSVSRYVMRFRDRGVDGDEVTRGLLPFLGSDDPFKVMEPTSLTYFSIYEEDVAQNDRIVANTQFESDEFKNFKALDNEVWICGANHVEARLAKQKEYIALCQKVRKWFPDKKIRYFPHRREQTEKVEIISRLINAEVDEFKYGIEEYVSLSKSRPHKLVVFGSTVADTLSRVFAPHDTVIVAAPGDKYFVENNRVIHVKKVIVDNVRRNQHVLGISASTANVSTWAKGKRYSEESTVPGSGLSQRANIPLFKSLDGLFSKPADGDWVRLGETAKLGVHRVILGDFKKTSKNEANFHTFRLRAEERFAFKLRVVNSRHSDKFVEVAAALDRSGTHNERNGFGSVIVEVEVFPDRTSVVSVFFKPKANCATILQLLALTNETSKTSRYQGIEGSGFSLAKLTSQPVPMLSMPVSEKACTAQISLAKKRTAIIAWRSVEKTAHNNMFCLHGGPLDSLKASRLVAPMLETAIIPCVNATRGAKDTADATYGLSRSTPLRLEKAWFGRVRLSSLENTGTHVFGGPNLDISTVDARSGRHLIVAAHDATSDTGEKFDLLF